MENWFNAIFHSLIGIVHFLAAFCNAKKTSLKTASSLGKQPFDLMIFENVQ
jgi:hypothetical protein